MKKVSYLFVAGAGFSSNAGLPLAPEFTAALLDVHRLKEDGPSSRMAEFLREFVRITFGSNGGSDDWPPLEDIFTLVDLSANTGHHLGQEYSAADLRTVRRALIVRLMRMLQQRYRQGERRQDDNWRAVETLLKRLDIDSTAILSLNWDCVVERGLARTRDVEEFDYGCDAHHAEFNRDKIVLCEPQTTRNFQLLKPHGSINWLYCDACRQLLWLAPEKTEKIAQTLFRDRDWDAVGLEGGPAPKTIDPDCPFCGARALGTRLATFSYRKALDFPMHASTWRQAEALLREAETWIFFGYSMPGADFEFKHLLKRVELSRRTPPRVILVAGGEAAGQTETTYRNFFGAGRKGSRTYFREGLTDEVINHLSEIGALRPQPSRPPRRGRD